MHAPPEKRPEIMNVVSIFRGRVVDVAPSSLIIEVTGSSEKVDNFIDLMRPYGIKELARSGAVALVRGDQARISLVALGMNGEGPEDEEPARGLLRIGATVDTTGDI